MTFPGGVDTYTGDLKAGKRNGTGTQLWSDGDRYDGEFLNDKRHGHGVYRHGNGYEVYDGEYLAGQRTGTGKVTFSDGHYYQGQLLDGKANGYGRMLGSDGRLYEGAWSNGCFNDGTWKAWYGPDGQGSVGTCP